MDLSTFKQKVAEHHDALCLPNRFVVVVNGEVRTRSGGCFYPLRDWLDSHAGAGLLGVVFHGDGAPMTFDALRDNEAFNKAMLSHTVPYNKFIGNEHSKRWVGFLLSDQSPWRDLRPHLAVDDLDYINTAGFIFKDTDDLPRKLAYNFAMAVRYPWEMPRNYELCLQLWSLGVAPAMAVFVSQHFMLNSSAKDFDGPYDVLYPWSFLEESHYDAVGRFVLGKPRELSTTASAASPSNVAALWETPAADKASDKLLNAFIADEKLTLQKILTGLNGLVAAQGASI